MRALDRAIHLTHHLQPISRPAVGHPVGVLNRVVAQTVTPRLSRIRYTETHSRMKVATKSANTKTVPVGLRCSVVGPGFSIRFSGALAPIGPPMAPSVGASVIS